MGEGLRVISESSPAPCLGTRPGPAYSEFRCRLPEGFVERTDALESELCNSAKTVAGTRPSHAEGSKSLMSSASNVHHSTQLEVDLALSKQWACEKENAVREPFDYSASHPGKDFRASLVMAFGTWLDVPRHSIETITAAVSMLHESSLMIDDIQDRSELRRGFPAAHCIFGIAQTINSANYIYFIALRELEKLNNPAVLSVFVEELIALHRGQGMDLYWRDSLTCPTESEYLEMIGNKTGGLFRLIVKLLQAESGSRRNGFTPLASLMGLIFQIRDDYLNLAPEGYEKMKGMCEDLTEGKFSFPIIHSIHKNPSDTQLINILKQRSSDRNLKHHACRIMKETGSFEHTRNMISALTRKAISMVNELDEDGANGGGVRDIIYKLVL